jgi:hypothetical protein
MVHITKVLSILMPIYLMEIIATSLYQEAEMQVKVGGLATVATNVLVISTITIFLVGLPIGYFARHRISQSVSVKGVLILILVFGLSSLASAIVAFFQRLYTEITPLYLPILIIIHLNLIPISYAMCLFMYYLCRFSLKVLRRFYLQEDIRQKKLEIDLKMLKRFEIENQLKSEINDIRFCQKELEYQSYLSTLKLKSQQLFATCKHNYQIIEDLCNNESVENEPSQEMKTPIIIHVGPSKIPQSKISPEICSICYERKVTHAIVSCGHPICGDAYCHDMLRDRCHICRQPCEKIIKVYLNFDAKSD